MARTMPHTNLSDDIKVKYAILPGDPARVSKIAAKFTDALDLGMSREYRSVIGKYKGVDILAMSTGMGGASMAIAVEELADLGFTHLIRIGSCGALQRGFEVGELCICKSAVCDDGASQSYLKAMKFAAQELNRDGSQNEDPDYILQSYPDEKFTSLCVNTAERLSYKHRVGITRCHDVIFLPDKDYYDSYYSGRGILATDMETAALFAVGGVRGVKTAAVLNNVVEWQQDLSESIVSYQSGEDAAQAGEEREIVLALETLAALENKAER